MATLYLIRHGQAGFGPDEYDVLSAVGATQAQALGRHLVAANRRVDLLFCAPRRRHRETGEALRRGIADAKAAALPERTAPLGMTGGTDFQVATHICPEFDEFPFGEILLSACGPQGLLAQEYAALLAELEGRNPLHDGRAFGRLFRRAMPLWIDGALSVSETFAEFSRRVRHGLGTVAAAAQALGPGGSAAVITSAGAIAATLQQVLGVTDDMMLRLCLALYNTGVSELRVRGDEISLITMNAVPHLLDPGERTFR